MTLAMLLLCGGVVRSELLGPYAPDADTIHLWHFNEPIVPAIDVGRDGTHLTALRNGATLGNASAKSFGLALSTYDGGPDAASDAGRDAYLSARPLVSDQGDNVLTTYTGPSGAFTYEALVRIDFDPLVALGTNTDGATGNFMQILSLDADEDTNRVCEFRFVPVGALTGNPAPLLEFVNFSGNESSQRIAAQIPTTGPEAIAAGNWYHVAVTYDGKPDQPDNLKLYWSLLDASRTTATLIGSGRMTNSLPASCQPDLAIGQTGRQSSEAPHPNNNFVGLIDEVRVSGVARPPSQMMFGGPVVLAATPPVTPPAIAPSPEPAPPPATGSSPKIASWLIAGVLLIIVGFLGWRTFVLKRLLATADEARQLDVTAEPEPAASAPQPRSPPSVSEEKLLDENVDRHTAAIELASEGFHGVLRKVCLQDLIQMECLNQRSTILEITSENISGLIYMEHGEILHATTGKYSGEKAFIKLFSLRGGGFNLRPFEIPVERTINCQWIHLLLEAARQRDEDTVRLTRDNIAFSRSSTNTEDILNMAAMLADHPQVTEILVCSNEGKTLYNSKCQDQSGRAQLCLDLLHIAKSAAAILPLGEFDQIEILRPESKTLIRGDQECHLLIGMETAMIA